MEVMDMDGLMTGVVELVLVVDVVTVVDGVTGSVTVMTVLLVDPGRVVVITDGDTVMVSVVEVTVTTTVDAEPDTVIVVLASLAETVELDDTMLLVVSENPLAEEDVSDENTMLDDGVGTVMSDEVRDVALVELGKPITLLLLLDNKSLVELLNGGGDITLMLDDTPLVKLLNGGGEMMLKELVDTIKELVTPVPGAEVLLPLLLVGNGAVLVPPLLVLVLVPLLEETGGTRMLLVCKLLVDGGSKLENGDVLLMLVKLKKLVDPAEADVVELSAPEVVRMLVEFPRGDAVVIVTVTFSNKVMVT